jgi:hypothetical protein
MFTVPALFSFLGGSVFRMIWGELSSWFTKKQDHAQEMERMRLQAANEAAAHERQMAAVAQQAALGLEVLRVQGQEHLAELDVEAFNAVSLGTTRAFGIVWIDAWNQSIRPLVATWSIVLITFDHFKVITMSENGWMLASAALGIYLADRSLFKRGK